MKREDAPIKTGSKLKLYRDKEQPGLEGRNHVFFLQSDEKYAVSIEFVQEIIKPKEITEIPHTPDFLRGVVNLRGKIVPVIDLRRRFGLPGNEITRASRIVVVRHADQVIGLLVDSVMAVQPIPDRKIEPVPEMLSGPVDSDFFSGIANLDGVIVTIIDLKKVLRRPPKDLQQQTENRLAVRNGT